jgi:hypothetical protein
MSQQLRDVLHLIVGKLSVSSEGEAQALHDLVDEALPDEPTPEPAPAPAPVVTPGIVTTTPQTVAPPVG